ncbi:hypothetical protein QZH41_011793, partial [Actinostola sp. cb2023]
VKCPALPATQNAYYYPHICGITGGRYEDKMCNQECKSGYNKVGGTALQCNANGTWTGSQVKCKKIYAKPWISCPSRIITSLPVGKNTTSVGSQWKLPQSNYQNITVSPAVDGQYQFPSGTTQVTWTVVNPEGKSAYCINNVVIQDKEKPKIVFCPGPKVFHPVYSKPPIFVKFKEPKFTDNVGVVRIDPPYRGGVNISGSVGGWNRYIYAYDKAGNNARCHFTVYVGGSKCTLYPDDRGYAGIWKDPGISTRAHRAVYRVCPAGSRPFGVANFGWYWCDESTGKWKYNTKQNKTDRIGDCVGFQSANKTSKCPLGYEKVLSFKVYVCMQCPLGTYYRDMNGNGTCTMCSAGTYQNQRGNNTCNKCPGGTSSLKGDYVCRDLCPPGTYSKDGMRPFCSLCPQGHYQPNESQTSCLVCPAKKFTNAKLGSSSCEGAFNNCILRLDLLVISPITKPKVWNLDVNNTLECNINNNNYKLVSVQWHVDDKGIPADFLGKLKNEEIRNGVGKLVGSRLVITRTSQHNADLDYVCVAANRNGETRKTVTIPLQKHR